MRRSTLFAAVALGCELVARAGHAGGPSDAERAAALFVEGRQAMATGDYAAACPKLAASQELAPAPDTALDLGLCYRKASEAAFEAAHDLARGPSEQAAAPISAAPRPSESGDASEGHTQRVVALTIVGAGAAGVIAGVVTGFMAKNAYDNATAACAGYGCAPAGFASFRSAHELATASTVSLLLGAGAVGAGALVFFLAPRPKPGATPPARIGFMPSTQGVSVSIARSF
ncbi:MAG: hypothetical protein JOZ69_05785 [Myxococcales bacterium]|nr:hypothetical protein [Myxococcales bacterium]